MSEPPQFFSAREMALAEWIDNLAERYFPGDDRKQVVAVCTAAMVIAAADTAGNLPDADKKLVEKFAFAIKNGCEKRGGKRSEAAVACTAVALAKVKAVVQ